jgi:hypothetical protein
VLLTPADIEDLTDAKKPSAQIRWLESRGWPFEISSKGRPKVLRAVRDARLGGNIGATPATGPNWDALNGTA